MGKVDKVINRDEIYAGKLINVKEIAGTIREAKDAINSNILPETNGQTPLYATYIYDYRSVMFIKDQKDYALDLLYNSKSYPILNITDNNICMTSDILIADSVFIGPILQTLGYGELMSLEEIEEVRKKLFSKDFIEKNSEMFGYEKLSSKEARKPRKLYELRVRLGQNKYRYNPFIEDALPGIYMPYIKRLCDNNIKDALDRMKFTMTFKQDAFKPTYEEKKATKKYIRKRKDYNNL